MARDRQGDSGGRAAEAGIVQARPAQTPQAAGEPALGLHPLGLDRGRDGLVYVAASYTARRPAPLALMLHGAGGSAQQGAGLLQTLADAAGLIVVAPDSRRQTWDIILGAYGPDVSFIDRALAQVFERYAVDITRLAVGGFSDGASYALSLGLINGDLFTHVVAFSPGFMAPTRQHGRPRIFISHGTHDRVLPIDSCSRRIVPRLRSAGYPLAYREFDGGHTIPLDIAADAMAWFTGG